jgi:ribosomal protein L29
MAVIRTTSRREANRHFRNKKLEYLKVKVKISLLQAVEAHRVARGRGSHII